MSRMEYGIRKWNTLSDDGLSMTNPILRMKLYNFALAQLRLRIRKSAYSHNCYRFSPPPLLPLSTATVIIAEGGGSATILLRYRVKPDAVFEATIQLQRSGLKSRV